MSTLLIKSTPRSPQREALVTHPGVASVAPCATATVTRLTLRIVWAAVYAHAFALGRYEQVLVAETAQALPCYRVTCLATFWSQNAETAFKSVWVEPHVFGATAASQIEWLISFWLTQVQVTCSRSRHPLTCATVLHRVVTSDASTVYSQIHRWVTNALAASISDKVVGSALASIVNKHTVLIAGEAISWRGAFETAAWTFTAGAFVDEEAWSALGAEAVLRVTSCAVLVVTGQTNPSRI